MSDRALANAYSRGYSAGMRRSWPLHVPIDNNPNQCAGIIKAARELRNEADNICSGLMEDDDFVKSLGPKILQLDQEIENYNMAILNTEPLS